MIATTRVMMVMIMFDDRQQHGITIMVLIIVMMILAMPMLAMMMVARIPAKSLTE